MSQDRPDTKNIGFFKTALGKSGPGGATESQFVVLVSGFGCQGTEVLYPDT